MMDQPLARVAKVSCGWYHLSTGDEKVFGSRRWQEVESALFFPPKGCGGKTEIEEREDGGHSECWMMFKEEGPTCSTGALLLRKEGWNCSQESSIESCLFFVHKLVCLHFECHAAWWHAGFISCPSQFYLLLKLDILINPVFVHVDKFCSTSVRASLEKEEKKRKKIKAKFHSGICSMIFYCFPALNDLFPNQMW